MGKVLRVGWREFYETVRTRTFLISLFVPVIMLAIIFGADALEEAVQGGEYPPRTIVVIDRTDALTPQLRAAVESDAEQHPNRIFKLETAPIDADLEQQLSRVRAGEVFAAIELPTGLLDGSAEYRFGIDSSQLEAAQRMDRIVNEAVKQHRYARSEIDRRRVLQLEAPVAGQEIDLLSGEASEIDTFARLITPFAFMFLLFLGTMNISQGLLTSVIEEKNSRIVEVLLAAVSPTQLMAGKIVGNVLVGAVLLTLWGVMGYFSAESRGMGELVSPYRLGHAALYFLPGFLLYAGLLAGIGAACNTLKEAQSLAFPVTFIAIVPLVLWPLISQEPHNWLSLLLSFIPPITPFVMILRICADPQIPLWQILATLALLWLSVLGAIWLAGKVFRVGLLMYGQQPSLRELIRWVRYT